MTAPEDIRLVSNFTEPYDHHFASRHRTNLPAWERTTETERTREEDHRILAECGLLVPTVGPLSSFDINAEVVAYVDQTSHRGEGKIKASAQYLFMGGLDTETYCSEYVSGGSTSLRACWIGRSFYCWRYVQKDPKEWRSNVGDVEIVLEDYVESLMEPVWNVGVALKAPLVAVDLVRRGDEWLAVDLATAPGLKGCPGIHDSPGSSGVRLGWRDVAEEIAKRWGELHA